MPAQLYDIREILRRVVRSHLVPIGGPGHNDRFNFDGFLAYRRSRDGTRVDYCQLFRNGAIEAVSTGWVTESNGRWGIPSRTLAESLIEALGAYLQVQRAIEAQPPVWVMLSLVGWKGMVLWTHWADFPDEHIIDRDDLLIPEVQVDDFDEDPKVAFRPVLDMLWQAAGFPRCFLYDEKVVLQGQAGLPRLRQRPERVEFDGSPSKE